MHQTRLCGGHAASSRCQTDLATGNPLLGRAGDVADGGRLAGVGPLESPGTDRIEMPACKPALRLSASHLPCMWSFGPILWGKGKVHMALRYWLLASCPPASAHPPDLPACPDVCKPHRNSLTETQFTDNSALSHTQSYDGIHASIVESSRLRRRSAGAWRRPYLVSAHRPPVPALPVRQGGVQSACKACHDLQEHERGCRIRQWGHSSQRRPAHRPAWWVPRYC